MKTTKKRKLTDEEIKNKRARIIRKYAMSEEQNDAWTRMRQYMNEAEDNYIDVPLSDIWCEELPGTEEMTVTLCKSDVEDDDCDYYITLRHNGKIYNGYVEDLTTRFPFEYFYTEINGHNNIHTMLNRLFHCELVRLLTKAGIFEDECKLYDLKVTE